MLEEMEALHVEDLFKVTLAIWSPGSQAPKMGSQYSRPPNKLIPC
jgi:hypothetical protein